MSRVMLSACAFQKFCRLKFVEFDDAVADNRRGHFKSDEIFAIDVVDRRNRFAANVILSSVLSKV